MTTNKRRLMMKMKGTFTTAEVLALMWFRTAPRGTKPMFRLQNFLLNKPDWKTSQAYNLHIGEDGELGILENLLGANRKKKIDAITERYRLKAVSRDWERIFQTKDAYNAYVRDVEKAIGKNVILSL